MASLSLPRVLQPRKTSLEIEREHFDKSQNQALQKAINSHETPVKQKHVRSAIIGTFHTQGAKTFWTFALRLPAMDDQIVAWKLCHVIHKILREGHPLCLDQSQRHRDYLDEVGKLWGHLREGYGRMIRLYTNLLLTKLEFHKRNPRFPGHLGVTHEELESISNNDVDNYFEMTVEMFDFLDNILELQEAVFGSLNMARSNSMTNSGQCRLSPLVPCIQEASKLYDYCVKILFKLHMALPPDTLEGHRKRFLKQFKTLKKFYEHINNLQYFKDLIAIPPLPEHPPNFLTADFSTYVTQEVVIPPQVPEPDDEPSEPTILEGGLIDTSDVIDAFAPPPINPHVVSLTVHQEMVNERDQFRQVCSQQRDEIDRLINHNQRRLSDLQNKVSTLEINLAAKDNELMQERQMKEEVVAQAFSVAQSQDSEQKQKMEKFDKLKEVYVKLRNDHINILREKADVDKKLEASQKKFVDFDATKTDFEIKLSSLKSDYETQLTKEKGLVKIKEEELQTLRKEREQLSKEIENLKKNVGETSKEFDQIQADLCSALQVKEELKVKADELTNKLKECELIIDQERKNYDEKLKSIVQKSIEGSEDIVKHAIHEVDNPALTALTCSSDYLKCLGSECKIVLQDCLKLSKNDLSQIVEIVSKIAHRLATFILQGRATGNTSPDINYSDKMADACKGLGQMILGLLSSFKTGDNADLYVEEARVKLEEILSMAESINLSLLSENPDNLANMLEAEMMAMDKAIEEAAKKIQDMHTKSREADSGVKLEVNSKILVSCTDLMQAIRILVQKSRLLQAEIVSLGRGTASAKDFYKRNHQWTDGFISAAKAVAAAAMFLLTAANKVVSSNGKLEQLVVAAQEIAASTAQMVVASRVKADRNSNNLQQLTQASRQVTKATATVVATVKDCSQLIEEAEELDVSNLTLHQAKRLEMESQVHVLELEKELNEERLRLSALRKHHYQLAGEN